MNKKLKSLLKYIIPALVLITFMFIVMRLFSGFGYSSKQCPDGSDQIDKKGPCLQTGDPVCTKANPCKNGGSCVGIINDRPGRCQCPDGTNGPLCETTCSTDTDCKNGGTCGSDGICKCAPGYDGIHCEIIVDSNNCNPNTGCNTIMINEIAWDSITNEITLVIMDPNVQKASDIPLIVGRYVCLGGFKDVDSYNKMVPFSQFNNWNLQPISPMYEITWVSLMQEHKNEGTSSSKDLGSCYYYCDGVNNAQSNDYCTKNGGNIRGSFTYDICSKEKGLNENCYTSGCLSYYQVVLKAIKKINLPTFPYVPYTYFPSGIYIFLPPTGSVGYKDTYPPLCYSGAKTDSSGLCGGCTDPWGPGRTYKTTKQDPNVWNNIEEIPMGGYCGRLKNAKQIALGLDPPDGNNEPHISQSDCQNAYGASSTNVGWAVDTCKYSDVDNFRDLCAVSDFWALPGTNCQTGDWARCDQCNSNNGSLDKTNSQGSCGLVGAPATTTATPYTYEGGNSSSTYCTIPSNTFPDPHI
jgi:hypothetical protein